MSIIKSFLVEKIANCDLLLVTVVGSLAPQSYEAKVERIYSARRGVLKEQLGRTISFIGVPSHWGQRSLRVGDRALLFVKAISGKLYEDAWNGHITLEELDGVLYGLYPVGELWNKQGVPELIKNNSREYTKAKNVTAIKFDAIEGYLINSIFLEKDGLEHF